MRHNTWPIAKVRCMPSAESVMFCLDLDAGPACRELLLTPRGVQTCITPRSKLDSLVEPGGECRSAKQSITSAVIRACCKACECR
jgi:hypothetical protein